MRKCKKFNKDMNDGSSVEIEIGILNTFIIIKTKK